MCSRLRDRVGSRRPAAPAGPRPPSRLARDSASASGRRGSAAARRTSGAPSAAARAAARRVDRQVDGVAEPRDPRAVLSPGGQPLAPGLGRSASANCSRDSPLRAASSGSTQGRKSSAAQLGKGQQQVAEVSLGIDRDHRDAVDRRLFQQRRGTAPSCRCRSSPRRRRAWSGPSSRRATGSGVTLPLRPGRSPCRGKRGRASRSLGSSWS